MKKLLVRLIKRNVDFCNEENSSANSRNKVSLPQLYVSYLFPVHFPGGWGITHQIFGLGYAAGTSQT